MDPYQEVVEGNMQAIREEKEKWDVQQFDEEDEESEKMCPNCNNTDCDSDHCEHSRTPDL